MKFFLGFVIVAGGIFAALYYGGGYDSFDPTQQGKDAKAAIAPGMAWKKVVDVAGAPGEYRIMIIRKGMLVPGPVGAFVADEIDKRVKENTLQNGFAFGYRFSESVAFDVIFDSSGAVSHMQDKVTMSTLLDMPKD